MLKKVVFQDVMGSILVNVPLSHQVLWKPVQYFLCNPANSQTNQHQMDRGGNMTSLVEVKVYCIQAGTDQRASATCIHPHHTQIAGFKHIMYIKELTLIGINVWQEKNLWQTKAEFNLGGTLLPGGLSGGGEAGGRCSDTPGLWCNQDEYLVCLCLNLVPNCEKIGYKLKNEDQVQSLGVILTLWKMQTPTVHSDHRRRKPGFLISLSVSLSPSRGCATEEEFWFLR